MINVYFIKAIITNLTLLLFVILLKLNYNYCGALG